VESNVSWEMVVIVIAVVMMIAATTWRYVCLWIAASRAGTDIPLGVGKESLIIKYGPKNRGYALLGSLGLLLIVVMAIIAQFTIG